ncbi:hypothetical protein ACQPXH_24530 [Nocardia sp. CA-135953]|uniref:hypothetical protein n=1 Tax=Nocardia sp. CA-135953 TaxID=3239978 RepID=UPI003D95B7E4
MVDEPYNLSEDEPLPPQLLSFLDEIKKRAKETGVEVKEFSYPDSEFVNVPDYIKVQIPRGASDFQVVRVDAYNWDDLLNSNFEHFCFTETYHAVVDTRDGSVEAALVSASTGRYPTLLNVKLKKIPGIEKREYEVKVPWLELSDDDPPNTRKRTAYILRVESQDGAVIEISHGKSFVLTKAGGEKPRSYTLKISHPDGVSGPRAKALLDGPARDFLFDLDVVHSLNVALAHHRVQPITPAGKEVGTHPAEYPALKYDSQGHALYWYALSAQQFPLLQFLAYYQILEFYFRSFTRESVIRQIQTRVKSPRFSINDAASIGTIIDIARPAHLGTKGEKEQLTLTIRGCTPPDRLRDILNTPYIKGSVCAKNQKLTKIKGIDLRSSDEELYNSVAARIYDIRCRIVHTKESSEQLELELLLPTDDEVRHLGPDIELVRTIAQDAIVHGAQYR